MFWYSLGVPELSSIVCICNAGQVFLIRSMFMVEPDKKFFIMAKPNNIDAVQDHVA
jgi:hypothetical protein